jgi:hypothetical protein
MEVHFREGGSPVPALCGFYADHSWYPLEVAVTAAEWSHGY